MTCLFMFLSLRLVKLFLLIAFISFMAIVCVDGMFFFIFILLWLRNEDVIRAASN